jgi:hypothetical protein
MSILPQPFHWPTKNWLCGKFLYSSSNLLQETPKTAAAVKDHLSWYSISEANFRVGFFGTIIAYKIVKISLAWSSEDFPVILDIKPRGAHMWY